MKSGNLKGSLILLLTAFIWGIAFVAQSSGAEHVPPFFFNSFRSLFAAVVLFLFFKLFFGKKETFFPTGKKERRSYYKIALLCGVIFTLAANLQQAGFRFYPEGAAKEARAGFLTALYVVIVPILSIALGKKLHPVLLLSVAVTTGGIYLLCLSGGIRGVYLGDIFMFLCAIAFSAQIMMIDHYVGITGGIRISIMQFLVAGVLSLILGLCFEKVGFRDILAAAPQILYLGILSSAVGYTLQSVGQKYAEPAVASLCMSMESVFSALAGWLIAGNALSGREILGCTLVFAAILIAQLPELLQNKKERRKE